MRSQLLSAALTASVITIGVGQSAHAQTPDSPAVSPQEFRELVLQMADTLGNRPGGSMTARKLREKVEAADPQTLEVMYQAATDWTSLRTAVHLMTDPTGAAAPTPSAALMNAAFLTPALPQTPFPPAYPAGGNYETFRATLPGLGAMSDTNGDGSLADERCDANLEAGVALASAVFSFASIAVDLGCHAAPELFDIPCFIAAEVVALAAEATNTVAAQCSLVDGAVDATEIEAAFENTVRLFDNLGAHHDGLVTHDTEIKSALSTHDTDIKTVLNIHDTDIKALLATLQDGVDEANQRLKVSEALQRTIIKLLLTPEGLRGVDPAVLSCTGDNCPHVLACPGPECSFPLKKR